jgi:hypothetical protein
MSRNRDENDATLRFDDKSNANNNEEGSKTRASTDVKLEDLMKRLEKLTAENNKLRKKVKPRGLKEALPQVKKTPHRKRKTLRKVRKEETIVISHLITQCPSIMIICLELLPTPPYPLAKLHTLMGLVITNGSIT